MGLLSETYSVPLMAVQNMHVFQIYLRENSALDHLKKKSFVKSDWENGVRSEILNSCKEAAAFAFTCTAAPCFA